MDVLCRDDFGVERGTQEIENAGRATAQILQWPVATVGNRSMDWATTDAILGEIKRDRRNWIYSILEKHEHPRFYSGTEHLSEKDQKRVGRARMFIWLQQLSLIKAIDAAPASQSCHLRAIADCPPNLFLVDRRKVPTHKLHPCRHAHACVYCRVRNAAKLHARLCHLVTDGAFVLRLLVDTPIPTLSDFTCVKRHIGSQLRRVAVQEGLGGGLLTSQVGPRADQRVTFALGEIGLEVEYGFTLRTCVIFPVSPDRGLSYLDDNDEISTDQLANDLNLPDSHIEVLLRGQFSRDACRDVIFGVSPGSDRTATKSGVPAALGSMGWCLAGPEQWFELISQTKNQKQYQFFGAWYGRGNNA